MKIGVDCDGVILNMHAYKLRCAAHFFPSERLEQFVDSRFLVESKLGESVSYREYQNTIYTSIELMDEYMELMPLAGKYISLLQVEHELTVITSRQHDWMLAAQNWLAKNQGLQLEFKSTGPQNSKLHQVVGLNYYLDDDNAKLEAVVGSGAKLFLLDAAYNRDRNIESVTRIYSWEEYYAAISNSES